MAHNISRFIDPRNGWCTQEIPKKWTEMGRFQFLTQAFVAGQLRLRRERNADPRPSVFQREEKESPAEASLSPKKW
jgi:hypothetical protein